MKKGKENLIMAIEGTKNLADMEKFGEQIKKFQGDEHVSTVVFNRLVAMKPEAKNDANELQKIWQFAFLVMGDLSVLVKFWNDAEKSEDDDEFFLGPKFYNQLLELVPTLTDSSYLLSIYDALMCKSEADLWNLMEDEEEESLEEAIITQTAVIIDENNSETIAGDTDLKKLITELKDDQLSALYDNKISGDED